MNVEEDLKAIQERNRRVEADKAWEISVTRKALIAIITYAVAALALYVIGVPDFYLGSVIPALGFLLSTLTFPIIKEWWVRRYFASIQKHRP